MYRFAKLLQLQLTQRPNTRLLHDRKLPSVKFENIMYSKKSKLIGTNSPKKFDQNLGMKQMNYIKKKKIKNVGVGK
tara:strand:+ start:170 stop:397 length:228 start_codon:yes stop_codon:yes gene_type:complete